ncbi:MAG: hypothetical protein PHP59_01635 [Methanofollis sp.]|uniref:hypothetical protein n=1 Tax=Methanofollis sp. TaxID=2052835 RepID=UPI00261F1F82|nr:hypothetical protein [Methanofollis sp.]MDD4254055.1 hypothetical protein [Methanofollis sp.]
MFAIRFYRIYDIGKEIDLASLERALSESMTISRARFVRVKPRAIIIKHAPLLLRIDPVTLEQDGKTYTFRIDARVYDIGAISICLIHEEFEGTPRELEETALRFAGQRGLDTIFTATIARLLATLRPAIGERTVDEEFYEDYAIYITHALDDSLDPTRILLGDTTAFSAETRQETLKNALSYSEDDRAILTRDSAILVNTEPPSDLIELIEYANVQLLELRFYDSELTRQMEKMYDDIEMADRLYFFYRIRQYRAIMMGLMQTQAEISEITEKVNNLIKVTEDVYYGRIYAMSLRVMNCQQWSDSVGRKIAIIRQTYAMLSDGVNLQHSNYLEWVVIILIALEVLLFVVPMVPH